MTTEHEPIAVEEVTDPGTLLRSAFDTCLEPKDGEAPFDPLTSRRGYSDVWDSVTHLELVALIERMFSVELDIDDIVDLETYADAVRILRGLGIEIDQ